MHNFEQVRSHPQRRRLPSSPLQDPFVACVGCRWHRASGTRRSSCRSCRDDDGRGYLRVSTAIAPTTGWTRAAPSPSTGPAGSATLAIGELDVPYLQLCENRPLRLPRRRRGRPAGAGDRRHGRRNGAADVGGGDLCKCGQPRPTINAGLGRFPHPRPGPRGSGPAHRPASRSSR